VVAYDDLGIHRLLLQVPDLAELRSFATAVLGELIRDRGRAELLQTLAAWFRTGGSPQRTARALHLHANTVSYRIRRVEEIAGLDLDEYQDRLMAQVACEIVEVLGPW
jgi:DNA-binding PucR family transcriptional regulator